MPALWAPRDDPAPGAAARVRRAECARRVTYRDDMPSHPLDPLTMLSVELSATMSRNRYTQDPGPVLAELQQTAGPHTGLLAAEAGRWAGFNETDPHAAALVAALMEIGAPDAVELGRHRFQARSHSTP